MKPLLLFLLLSLGLNLNAYAQDQDPKVGLVLSGGGAKGMAHIGALKVIDSLGIRIDYIAGTSMGAIVGSLYASGYSGKQLDSIFKQIDFDDILSDDMPREAKTRYERENSERYVISLPFDNFKVKLPTALSRGQNTFNLLSRLTLHINHIDDFNKLPIPFFCIATNVETGQMVLLDKGNLAQAVKASGAFPSLFQPVLINNQLLIDGGVVNNYPIDELKNKGIDVIIGVDVQDGLANRTDLSSAPEILFQINNFRTINDMKIKSKLTDIYIKPDIRDFNVVSFKDGIEIIKNGEKAALKQIEGLRELRERQIEKPELSVVKKQPDSIRVNSIYTSGHKKYTRSYVLGKLKIRTNETISFKKFNEGTNNLVATNNFDDFFYELKPSISQDGYDLYAEVRETKKNALLRLGVHYDDLYKSSFLVNFTKRKFLFKNDVASLDLILGDNVRYNFDYFIDKGFYWSIGLKSRLDEFKENTDAKVLLSPEQLLETNVNKVRVELLDITNQFYLQTLIRNDFSFLAGVEHKKLKITTETILSEENQNKTTFEDSDYLSVFGNMKYDTYDSKYFPNEGFYFNADANIYFYSSDFNNDFTEFSILKADFGYAHSFSDKFTAHITTDGGFTINAKSNRYLNFVLGGYGNNFINNFKPFLGYDYISLAADSYIKGGVNLDYEVFPKNHIILTANYANVENDLYSTGNWFSLPDYSGYGLGYSLESFIGPIEVKYTWSPDIKDDYWFFNLGFWF